MEDADVAAVAELLGRSPQGPFEVVVRTRGGAPVVIRNSPYLDDGTPMPTRYWLVGRVLAKRIGRLEGSGGVRAAERAVDAEELAEAHARYEAERNDAVDRLSLPPEHPRPSGGIGGTRRGVKCLHAHVAHHLVTGADPVGAWAISQLEAEGDPVDAVSVGDRSPVSSPGSESLT